MKTASIYDFSLEDGEDDLAALRSNPEIVLQTSDVPEVVLTAEQLVHEKVSDLCSVDESEEEEEEQSVIVNEEDEKIMIENSVSSSTEKAAESEITTLEMIQNESVTPSRSEKETHSETHSETNDETHSETPERPASCRWMENDESVCCMCCGKRFGLFRRRHVGVGVSVDG